MSRLSQPSPARATPVWVPTPQTGGACFGVMCPHHLSCQRYAAIEDMPSPDNRIATCIQGGAWPLFLAQVPPQEGAK